MIEFSLPWFAIFFAVFLMMEFNAWFLHKYVMHGFLWNLHKDHHVVKKDQWWQKNDLFAIFFAVPSFLSILFSKLLDIPYLGAFGFGVMFYGAAYFFVHEIIIHRRIKLKGLHRGKYIKAVKKAHHIHHSVKIKEGGTCFGMLVVPFKYFK